ncbi:MAG: energy transducer TonB [Tannerellaceae bacterium]|jgi:TonB family protein|nr:energy transducer TonB [Tannerellaceae bacterium]
MKCDKDDIYSVVGTVIFHLAILLILGLTVLKTVVPEEEEGVLVNFGNLNAAAGTFEPRYTGHVSPQETTPPPPTPPQVPAPHENLVTQDVEESVSLADAKKKEEERKREEERIRREAQERERVRREEAERKRLAEEQRKKEEAISDRVAGAFGAGNADSGSRGEAEAGTGVQGNPFGNSNQGANTGQGGYGSFNLNGRTLAGSGQLPRPEYTVQEEGRIVIDITVDPKGNVISAQIGKGTNIDSTSMRNSALKAARQAKFNSINGTNNQSGTITYRYRLQ